MILPKSSRCTFELLENIDRHKQLLEDLDTNPKNREFFPDGALSKEDIPKLIERFTNSYKNYKTPVFMIFNESKEFIGRAGFSYCKEIEEIEVGYVLDYKSWGKGYATEILEALLSWAHVNLSNKKIYAFTGVDHLASIKVMQKVGMKFVENKNLKGIECVLYEYEN
ncbi:GNAT family N-acetyltransferase [Pseudofrancisella aestuarii]|uniref:GNAT family N-acetyltransferase n=1 Tax=Pseudofrancisella aestuarii TaxID=2670347 RepID=A0ABV9T8Z6_9GAMM|nr:GNAT family N-acetyltransferase [Pseudofrancisella aestuarii]